MSNHGLFEITQLEDAQAAWEIFFNRFYSAELPKQVNVEFDAKQREFAPRTQKKVKCKRFAWDEKAKLAYYSDKDGRFHSDDFDDFLNGNSVKIPVELNETDFKRVEEAIFQGNYEDELFKNKNHVFYALWLFRLNKISRQQLSTILARDQFPENYPIVKTFTILDKQGVFTEDAKQMLIPILKNNYFTKFEDWHLQRFRLLIQAAPKSEQVFYISECDPHCVSIEGEAADQLGNALKRIEAWERTHYQDRLYDLHLSFGVMEARQIALKGIHAAAASRCKLGKISPGTIKEGVISNYRPTAISINESGVESPTTGIHGYPFSRMPAVTKHDIYHARLHNEIPSEFHLAFNHIKEIIATFTKIRSSSLQWLLTDREFPSFRKKTITLDDSKKLAKYFTEMLIDTSRLFEEPAFFFNDFSHLNLSEDGIAIIRDMVIESDKWKKLYKIDINFLGNPYEKAIQNMQAFIKIVEHEPFDAKLFSLRYRLFCDLPKKTYQEANKLIACLNTTLPSDLFFANEPYKKGNELKHKTVLKCNNAVLKDGKSALTGLMLNYMNANFTLNKEQMHCEFIQLEVEFKSIHAGSQFTTAKLDAACNKLDSLADKLMLLELCYQHILKTPYARRHAVIDCYFASFFPTLKNPLTLSQRKHIGLLKTKMDSLLSEHLIAMTDEQEKQQFKWVIENYFKLTQHEDWRINLMSSNSDHQANALNTGMTPTNA